MVNKFNPGEPVFICSKGPTVKGFAGKVVSVLKLDNPDEYIYVVEYYKLRSDSCWVLVEKEFKEEYLLPLDEAIKLLYLS